MPATLADVAGWGGGAYVGGTPLPCPEQPYQEGVQAPMTLAELLDGLEAPARASGAAGAELRRGPGPLQEAMGPASPTATGSAARNRAADGPRGKKARADALSSAAARLRRVCRWRRIAYGTLVA